VKVNNLAEDRLRRNIFILEKMGNEGLNKQIKVFVHED